MSARQVDLSEARGSLPSSDHDTPTVRFLAHGAERSGPPIYLLRLLHHWRAEAPPFTPELVVARPGVLVDQFRALTTTSVARLDRHSPEQIARRVADAANLGSLGRRVAGAAIRRRVRTSEPDVTVVNGATAPTVALLRSLRPTGEVLTIGHELSTGWFESLDPVDRAFLLARTDRFLAVSRAVERYLVAELGVEPTKLAMVHPPTDATELPPGPVGAPLSSEVLIAGSGMTDWRKAPELWLRMAAALKARCPGRHLRFVWLGGTRAGSPNFWPLEHDMRHLGLSGDVEFRGDVESPMSVLGSADVFVSTAREDAYPLACAEAISMGVPVVGFDVDGVGEMVRESGCGVVVPYPREDLVASEVATLLDDPERRRGMAQKGREFARSQLDVTVGAPAVSSWIMGRPT